MFLDDSACNLASLNLMQFRTIDGELDVEAFKHAVDVVLLAQEIVEDLEAALEQFREIAVDLGGEMRLSSVLEK